MRHRRAEGPIGHTAAYEPIYAHDAPVMLTHQAYLACTEGERIYARLYEEHIARIARKRKSAVTIRKFSWEVASDA